MANVRTILHLSPEAIEAIERNAPSPNKRGAWASAAIVGHDQALRTAEQPVSDAGVLERIEARLVRLERLIEQLLSEQGK